MLRISHVSKTFYSGNMRRRKQPAVSDVSFTVEPGKTFGLVGESGCGKSTLGRIITRLIPPTKGEIFHGETELLHLSNREFFPYRQQIQMIFQHPDTSLNPRMKLLDSLKEPFAIHNLPGKERAKDLIYEQIAQLGIQEELLERRPSQVSGGQIQRVVLARIMLLKPQFIVLDEPTSMLDVSVQAQVMALLKEVQIRSGVSYLLISHDLDLVRRCSDQMGVMRDGVILEQGNTHEIFERPQHTYTKTLIERFESMKES